MNQQDYLNQPLYGATFGQAVSRFFKKYAKFSGRASRSEYFWVYLFANLLYVIPSLGVVFGYVLLFAPLLADMQTWNSDVGSSIHASYESDSIVPMLPGFITIGVSLLLMLLITLATLVPMWALLWRRMHDANFPGPMALLGLIPYVGGIIVLILALQSSKPEGQRFDDNAGVLPQGYPAQPIQQPVQQSVQPAPQYVGTDAVYGQQPVGYPPQPQGVAQPAQGFVQQPAQGVSDAGYSADVQAGSVQHPATDEVHDQFSGEVSTDSRDPENGSR